MAFIGVAILINGGKNNEGIDNISLFGCLLVLSAGIIFAAVLRWTQRVVAKVSTQAYTSVSIVLGTITTLPFTLLLTENWQISLNSTGIAGLLYLAIGCSWLAYWLWNKGLNSVDANISGILVALEPLFGILFAVSLLGENAVIFSRTWYNNHHACHTWLDFTAETFEKISIIRPIL